MITTESSPLVENSSSFFVNAASRYKVGRNIAVGAFSLCSAVNGILLGTGIADYSDPARSKINGVVNGLWVIAGFSLVLATLFHAKKNAAETAAENIGRNDIQRAYSV